MKSFIQCLNLTVIFLLAFGGIAVAEEWYEGMENSTQPPVYNVGQQIPATGEMPLNRIAASLDIQSELAKQDATKIVNDPTRALPVAAASTAEGGTLPPGGGGG